MYTENGNVNYETGSIPGILGQFKRESLYETRKDINSS